MVMPPKNIRTGLIRIYLLIAIPWVGWFSYQTYTSYNLYHKWSDWVEYYYHKLEDINKNKTEKEIDKLLEKYFGRTMEDDFHDAVNLRNRYKHKLHDDLLTLPLIPFGLPILVYAYFWVADGFKRNN